MIQSVETHATLAEAQRAMGSDAIFMAGGTLVMVPLVVMVLIFQRRIISGLTAGGVKS